MIDLHTHSTYSDGSDTPREVVQKAKLYGLNGLALTDHDCIEGLAEAEKEAKKLNVNFYSGMELSTSYGEQRLIHILGIGFNREDIEFQKKYIQYRQRREDKLSKVFESLIRKRIPLKVDDLYQYAAGGYLDRQCVVKWLVANRYAESNYKAWVNYVDVVSYSKGELIEPEEVVDMIKGAGGKTYLAHYQKWIGFEGYNKEEKTNFLKDLQRIGIDGIERYYPTYTKAEEDELDEYIQALGLIPCGGTDYHGSNRVGNDLGKGSGEFKVPDDVLSFING